MSTPNLSLLLIMICFWAAYWVVNHFLIAPVTAVVAERERRLGQAEAAWQQRRDEYLAATRRLEAESERAAREAARRRAELRQEALAARQERLERAQAEAAKRLEEALDELARVSDQARAELRQRATELARLLASHLLEREVAS